MPSEPDTALAVRRPDDAEVAAARARLERARARTQAALGALAADLRRRSDWRVWYRANPIYFLAGAFLVGVCLSRRR